MKQLNPTFIGSKLVKLETSRTTILTPSNGECSLAATCDAFTHTYPGFDIAVHGELEEKIWQIVGTAVLKIYGQP